MSLDQKSIPLTFLITSLLTLFFPVLFPGLHLIFFAPFLIILFYQKSYFTCLWSAFFCGMIVDLIASDMRFGIYAIIFCMTAAILYSQRRNFFADSLTTLPIMTYLFCFIFTAVQALLMYAIERENIVSGKWILTDLFFMPALDALYAFVMFILPPLFFGRRQRQGKDYFQE